MIKHALAIIGVSILVIISMMYAQQALEYLLIAHDWVAEKLTDVFAGGQTGNIIRQLLALLAMPFAIALIPALIYWMAKRTWFPYFMQVVWVTWLVQTAALVIMYKA